MKNVECIVILSGHSLDVSFMETIESFFCENMKHYESDRVGDDTDGKDLIHQSRKVRGYIGIIFFCPFFANEQKI